jgi:hypothetical protein
MSMSYLTYADNDVWYPPGFGPEDVVSWVLGLVFLDEASNTVIKVPRTM